MGYITYIYTHTRTVVQCTSTSSLDRLQPAVAEYVQVAEYQKTVGFSLVVCQHVGWEKWWVTDLLYLEKNVDGGFAMGVFQLATDVFCWSVLSVVFA